MKTCINCGINLNENNQRPSDIKFGYDHCKICRCEIAAVKYEEKKTKILNMLGGKCECCNIKDIRLLCIDHINGGGNKEKKERKGKSFLENILSMTEEDMKLKYRCLCYNCNCCIGFWGKCEHKI
jgi:hypothetical protein